MKILDSRLGLSVLEVNNEISDTTSRLERALLVHGVPKACPSSLFREYDQEVLQMVGHTHGIYQFITTEMVEFVKAFLGERTAIEVACGYGTLGRELGIPFSDLKVQAIPSVKAQYEMSGQPVIRYPKDVIERDAIASIKRHNPKVALACWITEPVSIVGTPKNLFGPDESKILKRVQNYVVFGNLVTHGDKRIRSQPHYIVRADWLFTRSAQPNKNVIMIWGKLPINFDAIKEKFNLTVTYCAGL
ncbi:MAG: hypothetical protein ABJG42_24315 [Vibrio splendidus]